MSKTVSLREVFNMPGTIIPSFWDINASWFPEIPDFSIAEIPDLLADGRLVVRRVVNQSYEGDRIAHIHTLSFDGVPVMVTRDGGRCGCDYRSRCIVDKEMFDTLCRYIREKMGLDIVNEDLYSLDHQFFADEFFDFYSTGIAESLGFEVESPGISQRNNEDKKLFMLFGTPERIFGKEIGADVYVEALPDVPMPEYIRRKGFFARRLRALTDEEIHRNPRVLLVANESGYTQHWWYESCNRPANHEAIVV